MPNILTQRRSYKGKENLVSVASRLAGVFEKPQISNN